VRREREHAGLRRAGGGDHARPGARQHRVRRRLRGPGGATQVLGRCKPSRHMTSLSVSAAALCLADCLEHYLRKRQSRSLSVCTRRRACCLPWHARPAQNPDCGVTHRSMSATSGDVSCWIAGKLRGGSGRLKPQRPGRRRCERRSTRSARPQQTLHRRGARRKRSSPDCRCAMRLLSSSTAYRWHRL